MSKAPLGILVSRHGHRVECNHCHNSNGLDDVRHTGVFDLVAGFSPDRLSFAVVWSWLVVLHARLVSSPL